MFYRTEPCDVSADMTQTAMFNENTVLDEEEPLKLSLAPKEIVEHQTDSLPDLVTTVKPSDDQELLLR